jgi:hypothetical protein
VATKEKIIKRAISPEVQAKGAAALAEWRKERAYAIKKGGKFLAAWNEEQALKRSQRNTTPMQAIRNFCVACVETREDIKNCTARQCPIYMYRPYQKGTADV